MKDGLLKIKVRQNKGPVHEGRILEPVESRRMRTQAAVGITVQSKHEAFVEGRLSKNAAGAERRREGTPSHRNVVLRLHISVWILNKQLSRLEQQ